MTGIFLLIVVGLWLWACVAMTRALMRRWKGRAWGVPAACAMFVALLVAPVADEIVGKFQFDALCSDYAVQTIDLKNAPNRQVIFRPRANDTYANGTAIQIRINPHFYEDSVTGKVLVRYHSVHARGGWLVRALGVSETSAPLIFRSACAPADEDGFKKNFNITVIN
jgi:hypothetical protein